jgi:hypothetical protein
MVFPRNVAVNALFTFLCLFVFNATLFGQAVRNIVVSDSIKRLDDDGNKKAEIGFKINFFGITYDSVWVNNNGNVSFDSALRTYSPRLIQRNSLPILAPFFADVDTRFYGKVTRYGKAALEIAPGNSRNIFCVNWIDVGFYHEESAPGDRTILNSFQMILIDRSDIAAGDFDLEFNYDKIKWEAGVMSGGNASGLGGDSTASMGWSNGTTAFYSHRGSLQAGSFLDTGPRSLIQNRLNSSVDGRYDFFVRSGIVLGPKHFLEDTTFAISTLGEPGDLVGTIQTPLTPNPRFKLAGSSNDFILDSLGNVTVAPGTDLDKETHLRCTCLRPSCSYEDQHQYLTVIGHYVNSSDSLFDTAVVTIDIVHISNCEDLIFDQSFTLPENSGPGTVVGTIALNVPASTVVLSELGAFPSDFYLSASTGRLYVKRGANFDYETKPVYTFDLLAKVGNAKADTASISIALVRNRPLQIRAARDAGIQHDEIAVRPLTRGGSVVTVAFSVPHSGKVTAAIYDLAGRKVSSLVNQRFGAGSYRYFWDAQWFPHGSYVGRLQTGATTYVKTIRIVH